MPSLPGRWALVTGTGGLGLEAALATAGADVIVAGRDPDKGAAAIASINQRVPEAHVRFGGVDLDDLASIADFTTELVRTEQQLDILINNAGVMTPPDRRVPRRCRR
ncbi:SDR family NAD(P)-dependent oxidoreductase [Methylobrevis pamukkalensis]|nr:SDR family NAD(P)-dependent oxidoreductase [Methylobrevis pamukkalensis]